MENSFYSERDIRDDRKLCFFIVSYYVSQALNLVAKIALNISEGLANRINDGLSVMLAFILLLTLLPALRRGLKVLITLTASFAVLYLISYLIGNSSGGNLLDKGFGTFFICIPLAVYFYSIKDKRIVLRYLTRTSYFLAVALCLVLIFAVGKSEKKVYSMSASYALLLPTILQVSEYFSTKKAVNILIALASVVCILLFGARGPLICVTYYILMVFLTSHKTDMKKIKSVLAISSVLMVLYLWWNRISIYLTSLFVKFGITSRTLKLIVNNGLDGVLESQHRNYLYRYYWDLIKQKPFFGWGVTGGWISSGYYPHNLFLEYLLSFGMIAGIALGVLTIIVFLLPLFIKKRAMVTEYDKRLLMIFCATTLSLFVSGTFLVSINWFILLGLCISLKPNSRQRTEEL